MEKRMRRPLLTSLVLLIFTAHLASVSDAGVFAASPSRALIEKRRIVIVRTAELSRHFPERRRAVLKYPVVSGLPLPILRKVRAALEFKNIFDYSLAEYRQDAWLTEFDYRVNYNKNYILDITFTQSGVGAYPDTHTRHFAFDLKTGETMKADTVFLPEMLATLAGLVNARLQAEIVSIKDENRSSKDTDSEGEGVAGQAFEALSVKPSDLDEFMVGDKGVTFLYDAGFPHVIKAFEPEGAYFFSYAQISRYIRRDGPLGKFLR